LSLRAPDGREIALRVSAGASVFPEDGDTYERLLVRADRRMYQNKAQHKERPRLESVGQSWDKQRQRAAL
jgi:GGDEF domain-containing protein